VSFQARSHIFSHARKTASATYLDNDFSLNSDKQGEIERLKSNELLESSIDQNFVGTGFGPMACVAFGLRLGA
jgi:hypothetical protein